MNLRSNWCLFGFLTWVAMAGMASAQPEGSVRLGAPADGQLPPPLTTFGGDMGQVNLGGTGPGSYTKYDRTFRPRINVDTRGGGLYGYEPGYTNLGMFLPYTIEDDTAILFGDVRAIVTHTGKGGANVGAGWRWWMEDLDRIVGLSAWYDFDAGHAQSYDQIGLSFESLGRFVDFRTNGYMPIGKRDHTLGTVLDSTNTNFIGNGLFFNRTTRAEQTFTGFDTEVGGPVPLLGRYGVNGYLGGYHFIGNGQLGGSVTGLSTRLMAQVNEDVSVGVQLTDDNVFGTNVQAQVFVTLPEGTPSRWLRNPRVQDRLTSSVFRQFRVLAKVDTFDVPEAAINPKDGQPYFVTHIDPNGAATGAGTIANPLNSIAAYNNLSLAQRQQSDIIYVRPRTDDTNTNLDTGATLGTLTLFNGQRLLTTSMQNQFASNVITGGFGFLPGYVAGAELPNIFNSTGGDVVTLAANATQCIEVSGFDITGSATGNGIQGSNNTWVAINNNNIHDALNGVVLTDLHGTVAAGTAAQILDNNFHDNINDGFHVTNTGAPPLDVIVQGNSFVNNGDDGLQLDANGGSVINGIIGGAEITPADPGPPVVAAVTLGNTFRNNGAHGLHLTANAGTLNFLSPPGPDGSGIINNDFTANGLDGLHIETTNGSTGNFDVISNRFGLVNLGGVPIDNFAGALTGNQRYGMSLFSDSGTTTINIGGETAAAGTVLGNEFGFNRVSAIDIAVTGTSILNYDINNNTVRNSSSATIAAPRDAVTFTFNGISGTDPFFVTNNSDTGVDITSVTWNLAGTPARFDSNNVAIGNGNSALEPQNGSDLLTGLDTVNGFGVIPGGIPPLTAIGTGNPIGTAQIPDGSQSLTLGYLDFDPTEVFSATTILSNNIDSNFPFNPRLRDATPLSSLATAGSTVTVLFSNNLSTTFALSQVNAGEIAVAGSGLAFGRASPGFGAGGDGIHVSASGNSSLNQSMIHNNTVNGYGGFGIHVETSGSAQAPNIVIENNITSFNGTGVNSAGTPIFTGGGLAIERNGSSLFHALVQNNQIESNFNDGFTILGAGTVTGDMTVNSLDNSVLNNAGDGAELLASEQVVLTFNSTRDQFLGNNNSGFHALTTDSSAVQLDFRNVLATDNVESGFNSLAQGDSSLQVVVTSPVDPLFTAGTGSSFSNNGQNGLFFATRDASFVSVTLDNVDVNTNPLNGLSVNRQGASLFLGAAFNSSFSDNTENGILFTGLGSDPADPNQPLSGTANELVLTDVVVNGNGTATTFGNGFRADLFGDAALALTATTTTFNGNAGNGIRVEVAPGAEFGDGINGPRSILDGVTITDNAQNGIQVVSNISVTPASDANSLTFLDINANSGDTRIANNGLNGVLLQYPGGVHDVRIFGDTDPTAPIHTTTISANGQDGIHADITAFATATLSVDDVTLGGIAAADGNANDGIDFEVTSRMQILDGATTLNQTFNAAGVGTLVVSNSRIRNNGAHGLNLIGQGLNSNGIAFDAEPFQNFDTDPFGVINASVTGTTITDNALNGVNIDIRGAMGGDHRNFNTQNQLLFDANLIASNGRHGVFLESNAGQQIRGGNTHRQIAFGDPQPTNPVFPFDPTNVLANDWNTGDNTDILGGFFLSNYLNLRTEQATDLVFTNNVVQFNGTQTVVGDGVYIRVGTGSYLSADVRGNTIRGNLQNDLHIESFVAYNRQTNAAIIPPASIAANPGPDIVFLDDTAQLDLRLTGNTGNTLNIVSPFNNGGGLPGNVTPNGAFYPGDFFKNNFGPNFIQPRLAQLFQIDDGVAGVNAPINSFVANGVTTNVSNTFDNASWHLRTTAAGVLFPDPGFPEDFFTDPGDPFLP